MEVLIRYCDSSGYQSKAASLAARIEDELGFDTTLVRSVRGTFDVSLGHELIYSKRQTGRLPDEDALVESVRAQLRGRAKLDQYKRRHDEPGVFESLVRKRDLGEPTEEDAVTHFTNEGLIMGVMYALRPGKEATVYCCEAHPSVGLDFLAIKVYKSFEHRSFRNDAAYREGRITGRRAKKALERGSEFGNEVRVESWVGNEYETLHRLHEAGAGVPRPVSYYRDAILMELVGEPGNEAPMLRDVRLTRDEAEQVFGHVVDEIDLMLANDVVHADLSPYNILFWENRPRVIDFPQATDPTQNDNALELFCRDVRNVCTYFKRFGLGTDPYELSREIWEPYFGPADSWA